MFVWNLASTPLYPRSFSKHSRIHYTPPWPTFDLSRRFAYLRKLCTLHPTTTRPLTRCNRMPHSRNKRKPERQERSSRGSPAGLLRKTKAPKPLSDPTIASISKIVIVSWGQRLVDVIKLAYIFNYCNPGNFSILKLLNLVNWQFWRFISY